MSLFAPRRVLIPVDFTAVSRAAWAWARAVSAVDASIEVLYVYDFPATPPFGFPAPPLPDSTRRRLLARLRAEYPGARARVEEGDSAFRILRRARGADLIVMGSHARRGLARLAQASVCESVVHEAGVPVLAVRGRPRKAASVLAPVNLEGYALRGLLLAAQAAAALDARLTVLYVRTGHASSRDRVLMNEAVSCLPTELRAKVKPTVLIRSGQVVPEILAESHRHGLVVLTAHRKPMLEDFALGTTAERVLRHAHAPVLTAPSGR